MSDYDITYEELRNETPDSYLLVDIREESAAAYGIISGAVLIPMGELEQRRGELPKEKNPDSSCSTQMLPI